jgi:hypothetical protein
MPLDPRFFCSSDLEGILLDKDTGLPLAAGIINFYSDVNRTTPKDVYMLSGNPPYNTASFVSLGSSITLNSIGGYQDGLGSSIVIYYYPFEGLPTDSPFTDIQELYYVQVFSSGNVQQFTREAWPPAATSTGGGGGGGSTGNNVINYIPNGQFLAYNTPIQTSTIGPNTVSAIAQGGWSFRQTTGSTGLYSISFSSTLGGSTNLVDFPPNAVEISRGVFGNETVYELFIQWPDVNTFSRLINTHNPQISFNLLSAIKSVDAFPETLNVFIVQNFGGADTDHYTSMSNISVTADPNFNYYNTTINFPDNTGVPILGSGSYVGLAIRMPSTIFDLLFTDFALTITNTALSAFPYTSPDEVLSRGINGFFPVPDPAGSDLYLPLVLTPQGMTWDASSIGSVVAKMTTVAVNNELLCDGTQYQTNMYSSLGIPYSRLQKVLFDTTNNGPRFGTGSSWINVYETAGISGQLILRNNQAGSQAFAADSAGGTTTGFTFPSTSTVGNIGATGVGYTAYSNGTNGNILAVSSFTGTPNAVLSPGTSTMTMFNWNFPNISGQYQAFEITPLPAISLSAGSATPGLYFKFSNHTITYYMWFQVAGETDPAPGGTGIQCNLVSGMSAIDVGIIISNTINRYQNYPITITGQPTNGAGSYFTFQSNSTNTAVWYQVGGVGAAPAVTSLVMVPLTGTENAAQVAFKTQTAINSAYFAVPDLRGLFLRGTDASTPNWDLDNIYRGGIWNLEQITQPGTLEFMQIEGHEHFLQSTATAGSTGTGGGGANTSAATGATGGSETRPVNMTVNYFMKY